MIDILREALVMKKERGGHLNKLRLEEMLLMALEYLREYPTYFHISQSYGVSESSAYKTIHWVEDTLIKCKEFSLPGLKALLDATESPIERPQKNKDIIIQEKKKRLTLKTQVIVDKKTAQVICTNFCNGKRHDFRLFKESKVHFQTKTKALTDTSYQGIQKIHVNSELPKKKRKNTPLTKEDKKKNRCLTSQRVLNDNIIGLLKRFKIIDDRYRNRRKRLGLRFNLIAGICNFEIAK